jgi:DNA-binding NarL/FixJ family response regulator
MIEQRKIRVLCVDDHPLFLEGIARVITHQHDMDLVGTASNGADALARYRESRPDVTLMDLRLPDMDGINAMAAIRREFPDSRVMMLTTFEGDVDIQRALAAGARGYMLKTSAPDALLAGIRAVHAGRKHIPAEIANNLAQTMGLEPLSEREIEILRELAEGHRNREIALHLSISEETVKGHVRSILDKLCAKDRTQAVSIGVRRGIIYL